MPVPHPKLVRRRILAFLHTRYQEDPLNMLGPEEFLEEGGFTRGELVPNIHYLADRHLVEMMLGYRPPMFSGVRITPAGIDLVEDEYRFNLQFPPSPDELEAAHARVPLLVERLVAEVDLCPLDGETRKCMLRDVQYLRDEIARPAARWRRNVIHAVLDWLEAPVKEAGETLPSLPEIREAVRGGPESAPGSQPEYST